MPVIAVLIAAAAFAGAPGQGPVPTTLGAWRPDVRAARAYALSRPGEVSFGVRTNGRFFGHRTRRGVRSASVVKALLLVAYLRRPGVRGRPLRRADRRLLGPMVRRSDNRTASRVFVIVGERRLRRVARHGGMRRFATQPTWGMSRVDAADLTRWMLRVDRLVPRRHRDYALRLLATVVPSQRWGIARVAPRGWQLFFKGGWGSGRGAVDHQVALLVRGPLRVAVAITTTANGSHAEGKRTLRGVAVRLVRGLGRVTASAGPGAAGAARPASS